VHLATATLTCLSAAQAQPKAIAQQLPAGFDVLKFKPADFNTNSKTD